MRWSTTQGLPGLLGLSPLWDEGEYDLTDFLLPIRKLGGMSFCPVRKSGTDVGGDTHFNRRNSYSLH